MLLEEAYILCLLLAYVIRHDCQHDSELLDLHIKFAALWKNCQDYDGRAGVKDCKILIFGIGVFRWQSENAEIIWSFMCDTSSTIIHKETMVRT